MTEEQLVLMEISAQLFAIKFEMFKSRSDKMEFNRRIEEYAIKASRNKSEDERKQTHDILWNLKFKEEDL